MSIASAVWESDAAWAAFTRTALAPASALYRGVTGIRNSLYDRGTLTTVRAPIPVVSVGNLAVGGT